MPKNKNPIIIKKMEGKYINISSMTDTIFMIQQFNTHATESDYIEIFGEDLGGFIWSRYKHDFARTYYANIMERHRKRLLEFAIGKYYQKL